MKTLTAALILMTGPAFAHTNPQIHLHSEPQWGAVLAGAGLILLAGKLAIGRAKART